MLTWQFYLREALSELISYRLLGEFAGPAIELDYELAANAPPGLVETFLSAPPEPNSAAWPKSDYTVTLTVNQGPAIGFAVELWRADLNGNDIAQIGSRTAEQFGPSSGQANFIFTITDSTGQQAGLTDRLKLKVFAENTAGVAETFALIASQSSVLTPIVRDLQISNIFNAYRRGRFLGSYLRAGEGSGYFDDKGVDLT